jgi:hypothetical protein
VPILRFRQQTRPSDPLGAIHGHGNASIKRLLRPTNCTHVPICHACQKKTAKDQAMCNDNLGNHYENNAAWHVLVILA